MNCKANYFRIRYKPGCGKFWQMYVGCWINKWKIWTKGVTKIAPLEFAVAGVCRIFQWHTATLFGEWRSNVFLRTRVQLQNFCSRFPSASTPPLYVWGVFMRKQCRVMFILADKYWIPPSSLFGFLPQGRTCPDWAGKSTPWRGVPK